MGQSNSELATVQKKVATLRDFLERAKGEIEKALPSSIPVDRVLRVALTSVQQNPSLLRCTEVSIYRAVLEAAQLGLTLDGPLGYAYLIPFGGNATMMLGYRGIIRLLHTSGEVVKVMARSVYEKDTYEVRLGTSEEIVHRPSMEKDRGPLVGVYSVAWMKNGSTSFDYMTREEIEDVKNFVKAKNRGKLPGPWRDNEAEMSRKSVLRRHSKYLPLSPETLNAIVKDEYREVLPDHEEHDGTTAAEWEEIPEEQDPAERLLAEKAESGPETAVINETGPERANGWGCLECGNVQPETAKTCGQCGATRPEQVGLGL